MTNNHIPGGDSSPPAIDANTKDLPLVTTPLAFAWMKRRHTILMEVK